MPSRDLSRHSSEWYTINKEHTNLLVQVITQSLHFLNVMQCINSLFDYISKLVLFNLGFTKLLLFNAIERLYNSWRDFNLVIKVEIVEGFRFKFLFLLFIS